MQALANQLLAALRAIPGLEGLLPPPPGDGAAGPGLEPPEYVGSRLTIGERRHMAMRPPSFTDLLPYVAYRPDERLFVLNDCTTLGVLFELGPIPTEAQPAAALAEKAHKVKEALQAIPEVDDSPWVVQFFLSDDYDLSGLVEYLRAYIAEQHKDEPLRAKQILESPMTRAVLEQFRRHLIQVSKPEGLFEDTEVTFQPWRGQQRRVRCCVYRRLDQEAADRATSVRDEMEAMASTMQATLTEAGVKVRRCTGADLYAWLLPFFNPKVPGAASAAELMRMAPYAGDGLGGDAPGVAPLLGNSLAESLNLGEPYSDLARGLFSFGGLPVKALTLESIKAPPQVGHFSAELSHDKESFARFDRLPPGSMLSITLVIRPQYKVEQHISRMRDASRATHALARETFAECERVLSHMATGDKLLPMFVVFYLAGNSVEEIDAAVAKTNALLVPTGLRFIAPQQDLVPLDAFMRGLPFNFDPAFDEHHLKRSRLTFASHAAALLPVYGRARGTPHPGMWFWNRGGEPLWVDPLNRLDRKKNAHMLVLGPTGAGKSATLNYLAMATMAIHRPRLVIVDAGNSFGLLAEYFKAQGLSTHCVTLTTAADVSLPPFVHALKLLDDGDIMSSFYAAEARANGAAEEAVGTEAMEALLAKASALDPAVSASGPAAVAAGDETEEQEDGQRDYLGEMLIAAIMMITGGESREEARMSRADRYLITRAVIRAAIRTREEGRRHPLVHDVANELMAMQAEPSLSQGRRERAEDMGQSMMSFCHGLRGTLFNREGRDWPDADVTLVEMGTLTKDGYGDALAVAYTSLIDAVQGRGEAHQAEGRPLIFLTDEGHLITTNDLLGPKIAKGTKMWRKLNMWFWLATQNLQDFPDSMERVLSMCEWWMLLTMDKSEIEQVARFRSLTSEQRHLMESARKAPGKYTEGVLISASSQTLFRNVPPALPIALAQTEGYEKAHRRRLMEQHGCSELQAAMLVAEEIEARRG